MRRIHARGIVAMEEEATRTEEAAEAEIGDNAESLETDLIEVADDSAEQGEEEAQVEEAGEVVEALEAMYEALSVSAANGGLDRHAAKAIGIATEHLYSRVGIELKPTTVTALESFGGTSSRVGATQLAMEDMKAQAKKIWNSIIAHIKRAIQWAVDFYNKLFGAAEKLAKRAAELEKKADAITGTAKEKTFESERLVKALAIGGNVNSNLSTDLGHFKTIVVSSLDSNKFAEQNGKDLVAIVGKKGVEKNFIKDYKIPAFSFAALKPVSNPESAGFAAPKEGLGVLRSDEMFGGKAVISVVPTKELTGEAAVNVVSSIKQFVGAFNPKAGEVTKKAVPTLSPGAAAQVAKTVNEVAEAQRSYRKNLDTVTAIKKEVQKAIEDISKSSEGGAEEERANYNAMKKVLAAFPGQADQPAAALSVYALNTGKALLDYVEESLKQYKAD